MSEQQDSMDVDSKAVPLVQPEENQAQASEVVTVTELQETTGVPAEAVAPAHEIVSQAMDVEPAQPPLADISAPLQPQPVQTSPPSRPSEPMVVEETRVETTSTTTTASFPQNAPGADVFSAPITQDEVMAETTTSEAQAPAVAAGASLIPNGDDTARGETPDITVVSQQDTQGAPLSFDSRLVRAASPPRMVRTGYVYDPLMMLHCPDGYTPTSDDIMDSAEGHPEEPMRIKRIFSRLAESGLIKRMKKLDFSQVTFEQVLLVHSEDHWNKVQGTEST